MHLDYASTLPVLRDRLSVSEQPRRFHGKQRASHPACRIYAALRNPRRAVAGTLQRFRFSWKYGKIPPQSYMEPFVLLAFVVLVMLLLSVSVFIASMATPSMTVEEIQPPQERKPLLLPVRIETLLSPISFSDIRPGVSLVACCMNRHDTLRQTLPTWLDIPHVNEIVVVDWSSSPPLIDMIHNITRDRRVKVIRVESERDWVLSRAYNLGIGAASREEILRTDCDYKIERGFVRAHELNVDDKEYLSKGGRRSRFFAGNYNKARDENEVHLNGAVFIRREDFMKVGGYDERIQTYGWDDEDLYNRLARAHVEKHDINYDHVKHVPHNDGTRVQKDVKFAQVEIDLNQLVLEHLEPWSANLSLSESGNNGATQWQVLATDPSMRYMAVVAISIPTGLQDQINRSQLNDEWELALGRRLNNEFQVPWDIIVSMDSTTKRNLLQRLYRADASRSGKLAQRILFAHVQHGLGNRLRALASAMAFAKNTDRVLVIVWETDAHISAKFTDLFETEIPVIAKFKPSWPFANHEKFDKAWRMVRGYNYQEIEGKGAVKDAYISDYENKHIYFKSSCIMNTDIKLSNWELDNDMLRSLQPAKFILDAVDDLQLRFNLTKRVGIHVRDRTLNRDIDHVNFTTEYGDRASSTMDYWRRKSSHKVFAAEMRKLVQGDPSTTFYVATDTVQVLQYFVKEFPGRIVYTHRDCDGRDGYCVRFALIDILALSKTKMLYGSNWSSFTEAAERFGGLKAKLAGQDFAQDGNIPA